VALVLDPDLARRSTNLVGDEMYAPALLIPESLNALKRQITRKLLSRPRATLAMRRIHSAPIDLVSMHSLTESVWELASTFSTYDACYVALAKHLDAPLLTCDNRLATEAKRIVSVITPD